MEDYNKIIESLDVKFLKSRNIKILQPLTVANFNDLDNTIILLHKGEISFGNEKQKLTEGDILFIPGGQVISITYGKSNNPIILTNKELHNNLDGLLISNTDQDDIGLLNNSFSYITFEAKVFESVSFFSSLDIPAFVISATDKIAHLIIETLKEELSARPGKDKLIKLNTERIAIEVIRFILNKRLFVEQLATNSTYFKDPRLIEIFAFIKHNLGGNLSNKALAGVVNVSEDYVGQYFKMLTGINPQDFIEYQRMEMAVNLLRTSQKSIRDISREIGYKDTAYFCRRFKMMFGIPAARMRKRESMM